MDRLGRIEHAIYLLIQAKFKNLTSYGIDELRNMRDEFKPNQSDTSAIIAQIKAIPWADWVKWVAMDENEKWCAYNKKPRKLTTIWDFEKDSICFYLSNEVISLPIFPDWTQSLIKVKE